MSKANDYFELVKPTYIESWPKELCSLSLGQVSIRLSQDEIFSILDLAWDGKFSQEHLSKLIERLDFELKKFPNGAFVRLGSRSPKDMGVKPVKTGNEILTLFINSMRIFDDLTLAHACNYAPYIFLREWKDINPAYEFRCFMKDRKLVGISQYNYREVYPTIIENQEVLPVMIKMFFESFKLFSHLDTVIFDVYLVPKTTKDVFDYDSKVTIWETKLLEINPFFELTDPCLFDWRKPEDFKGQFLFKTS